MPYCEVHCLKFAIFAALSVCISIITIQSTNQVSSPPLPPPKLLFSPDVTPGN